MVSIMLYSYTLIAGGFLILVGALIGLAYSKKEEYEVIKIFQERELTLSDRFILPFRMHHNGEIHVQLLAKMEDGVEEQDSPFKAYLTDLYANIDMLYSYGPKYLEHNQLGALDKTLNLKIGDYNLIFRNSGNSGILLDYTVSLIYPDYPYEKFVDWSMAFVDIGVSMLLVGLTLYLG